jgi:hypothetical protein
MKLGRLGILAAAVAGLLVAASGSAKANSITLNPLTTPTVTGTGPYVWTYTPELSAGNSVQTRDFFTIIDFAGYTGAFSIPAGWTLTVVNTLASPVPGLLSSDTSFDGARSNVFATNNSADAADNPTLPDLVLVRTGAAITPATGPTSLGSFQFTSIYNQRTTGLLLGRDTTGLTPGITSANAQPTSVPAVPVPAAAYAGFSMLSGLGVFGAIRRRRMA